MQQSVIYQEWKEEFLQAGEQAGILKGEQALVFRLLTRRVVSLAPDIRSQVQALSLAQLESLGEALLDFSEAGDLVNWLQTLGV
jgi:predicted transposase YdaD